MYSALGYVLHPSLRAGLGPGSRIADIGTGTGVVLSHLAQTFPPSFHFDGFDVSDAQFPNVTALPRNVQLRVADAKQPFPEEVHASYDVVFIRYLNLALSTPDWAKVATNVLTLLKPGGHIHWIEPDLRQCGLMLRRDSSLPTPAFHILKRRFLPFTQHLEYAARELEGVLAAVGYSDIVHEITSTDRRPEDRDAWTVNSLDAISSAWEKLEAAEGVEGYSSTQVRQTMEQLYKEGVNALYCRNDLHLFIGRKP